MTQTVVITGASAGIARATAQYWVGGSTAATLLAQKVAPALLDR
jgi:NADP-dependent 3-hydroxy acid dehydrogenase YdfG